MCALRNRKIPTRKIMIDFSLRITSNYDTLLTDDADPSASIIEVQDMNTLRQLLGQLGTHIHGKENHPKSIDYINYAIPHETDHARAVRWLGASVTSLGVTLAYSPNGLKQYAPYVLYTSRSISEDPLKIAAVKLHPIVPSDSDIASAAKLGYDVERVGCEAWQLRNSGILIPIPRSYKRPTKSVIDLAPTAA